MEKIIISLFKGYADKQPVETTLDAVVELIRSDETIKLRTEKFRHLTSQGDNHHAAREKSGTPCFAVAVQFRDGKQKCNISGWTGLCLADFDHIPAEQLPSFCQRVMADPHTLLSYVTISGKGLRILYHATLPEGNTEQLVKHHARLFDQGNRYYEMLLGIQADRQCKNVTRLSGLAHDSQAYYNPHAQPLVVTHFKQVTMIIEKELKQQGAVYESGRHNDYIMRTGYLMNQYGVPENEAVEWAVNHFSDYNGDVAAIFHSCYQHADEHGIKKVSYKENKSQFRWATVKEIEEFLSHYGEFRHNEITGKTEMKIGPALQIDTLTELPKDNAAEYSEIDDRCVNTLWLRLCKEVRAARIQDLRNVLASDFVPRYNPFKSYFDELPPWDGVTDYIGQLAATVDVVDNDHPTPAAQARDPESSMILFDWALRKWIVAMVASLLDHRVINHEILVLIGPQGSYKTTWLNRLLPPPLQRYFFTKSNNHHIGKDDMFTLTEFAIICLEEIEELKPSELNQLKAIVTMTDIHERAAYAHYKEHRPRIASFCGTSNHTHFLTDPSGNRRWMPFEVRQIRSPYTNEINYQGLYGQAYALWKQGFPFWMNAEETVRLNRYNQRFEVPNPEYELILTYFRRPEKGEECIFASTSYILSRINGCLKQPLSLTRLSQALKKLGFEQYRNSYHRGYHVVELKPEEVRLRMKAGGL